MSKFGIKGLYKPLQLMRDYSAGRDWNGRTYVLGADMVYETKSGIIYTVPKGFKTDLATWIKPSGRYLEAAVLHDYLYSIAAGRKIADKLFKELMYRGGCTRFRTNIMYYGVRLFGWWSYYGKNSQLMERE